MSASAPDSADYATLLDWIRTGADYGDRSEGGRIERVTVFPQEAVLDGKGVQQLLVTAYGPDGRSEDISHQARYVSQNPHVVTVNENGRVTATGRGETTVLIRTAGHAVSARFGVVDAGAPVDFDAEPRNLIDRHIFAKLRKFQIRPSELAGDSEFLRRVCLDIAGTLPPPDRVREFLADRDPRKRDKLIETLLDSPQYADYWSFLFADLFRVTYTTVAPIKEVKAYDDWVRNGVLQNKPYDRMARERIAAQGFGAPTRHFFRYTELIVPHEIMAEQVRLFMGRRLDCAQCHNHPFETWSQDQFWGMTAFFGNVTQLSDSQLVWDNPEGGRSYDLKQEGIKTVHPRRKEEVRARFMDGSYLTAEQERDPRLALADWIIAQPAFAETIVNRVWGYFFGRGIVDPVDDFKVSNPPTHPELLSALAEDFVENGYDLKHLMRRIVRSRTYQTSGVPNRTNREDGINYSRALALAAAGDRPAGRHFRRHRRPGGVPGPPQDGAHRRGSAGGPSHRPDSRTFSLSFPRRLRTVHAQVATGKAVADVDPGPAHVGGVDLYHQDHAGRRTSPPGAEGRPVRFPDHRRLLPGGAIAIPDRTGTIRPGSVCPGGILPAAGATGEPDVGPHQFAGVRIQSLRWRWSGGFLAADLQCNNGPGKQGVTGKSPPKE